MRYESLDSWRGIAALMVALYHFQINSHVFSLSIVQNASLFVDFFFILSGFVISHAYANALRSGMPFLVYAMRRVGRLWPLHAAVILVLIYFEFDTLRQIQDGLLNPRPIFAAVDGRDIPLLLQSLFLIQGTGLINRLGWNPPAWSISAELWVCLAFAGLAIALDRRRLVIAAVGIVAVSMFALTFSGAFMGTVLRFALFKCAAGFFTGHLIYAARERLSAVSGTAWEVVAVVGMVVFLSTVDLHRADPATMLAPLVFGLVVLTFSFESGRLSRVLKGRAFLLVGAVSYSIYLTHDVISSRLGAWARACVVDKGIPGCWVFEGVNQAFLESPFYGDAVVAAYLAIVIAVSCLTYVAVEQPGRHLFNWISRRMAGPQPQRKRA